MENDERQSSGDARKQEERKLYIASRWTQLSDACATWDEEALKYLLAVNTAGLAGTLSFLGAMPPLRALDWPKTVLGFFAAGLMLVGAYHLVRHHRTRALFWLWRRGVDEYNRDHDWNRLRDGDVDRSRLLTWPLEVIFHGSMLSFFAAVFVVAVHIGDITQAPKEVSNERAPHANTPNSATNTTDRSTEPGRK
jgi:hypothetical protein